MKDQDMSSEKFILIREKVPIDSDGTVFKEFKYGDVIEEKSTETPQDDQS